jgi:hypothetical protein
MYVIILMKGFCDLKERGTLCYFTCVKTKGHACNELYFLQF